MSSSPYFLYIVRCRDRTLYTGIAKNVAARLRAHNEGKGAKYTRGRGPVRLLYVEKHPSLSAALKREAQIKRLSRAQKAKLIGR